MKVILGSKSKDKIKILRDALKELHLNPQVTGVEVDPGITDQPLDKKITRKGAVNRATMAFKKSSKADFSFGLEGGLHDYGEGYHLVTYACLIDKGGKKFVGEGEEIHLPEEVSEKVKNGEWFGDVIREYAKDHEIDENLITRLSPFTQAVQSAYAEYLRSEGNLGFRKKSLGIIIDSKNNFLVVQLLGYADTDWNFPGGGIENGETPKEALLRELKEELGTDKFKILKKSKYKEQYDWPNWLIARDIITKKRPIIYRGQEVTSFLLRFVGKKEDIKPDPGEIKKIKWIKLDQLKHYLNFKNQLKETRRKLKEFGIY